MHRPTLTRVLASLALIAVGIGLLFAASRAVENNLLVAIGWISGGAAIGGGFCNFFDRPIRGAAIGLALLIVVSILIQLFCVDFHH